MGKCFVIQPFDKGPFDRRYEDVITPSIKDADLEAYRVDQDPAVNVPIESVETGIQDSEVCLADITIDNPNVWFEVGYAIAAQKQVVFICAETRKPPFPFDVQHRSIIEYATGSPRDFVELQRKITQRLKAIIKSNQDLGEVSKLTPTQTTEGLAPHEVAALIILTEESLTPNATTPPHEIQSRMKRAGFTSIAASLGLKGLYAKGFMDYVTESNDFGNTYSACSITQKGSSWIMQNQDSVALRSDRAALSTQGEPLSDEDISF